MIPITVKIKNKGPRISVGTRVFYAGIKQLEVVDSDGTVGEYIDELQSWWLPVLDVNEEANFTLYVENPEQKNIKLTCTVIGEYFDPDDSNNTVIFYIGKTCYP